MLEYGAYLWTLSYEKLNELIFLRTNQNLADLVGSAAGDPSWDEEGFRSGIEESLSSGAFILVIAVDEMNDELERTMRFINMCGNPSFNFTVLEMRRFQRDQAEILIPNLHSTVNPPTGDKRTLSRKQWTEDEFFTKTKSELPIALHEIAQDLYIWSKSKADRVWFGIGIERGSYTFHYLVNGKALSVFSVYTSGTLTLNFGWMRNVASDEIISEFHNALTRIPGFAHIPPEFTRWPSVKIDIFQGHPELLAQFKVAVDELGTRFEHNSLNENRV